MNHKESRSFTWVIFFVCRKKNIGYNETPLPKGIAMKRIDLKKIKDKLLLKKLWTDTFEEPDPLDYHFETLPYK